MVHQRHLSEGAWQESYTQGGHSSPACLLLGTMLQYPWQHASRLPCAVLLDERWHPRAALEISLWHPTPQMRSQKHPNPPEPAHAQKMVPWPGRLRPTPSLDNHRTQTRTHTHLEISPAQLIWATRACTRWLISTPDIPLSSANVNTIALVPQIALQPRKTRLTFHWAAFCALY